MEDYVLLVNACTRKDSRTKYLADLLIKKLGKKVKEINLDNANIKPLVEKDIIKREELIEKGDYNNPFFDCANALKHAKIVIFAAPYWDFSFPASLKVFIENVCVNNLTFKYDKNGVPIGLCEAKKLYYVTTAGGKYDRRFSFDYLANLCAIMLDITDAELIYCENLDVIGTDVQKELNDAATRFGLL